jgi:hypothetical protein
VEDYCVGHPGFCDGGVNSDAGAMDAGVMDAGVMDAGVMDAGVPDAGPRDAGIGCLPLPPPPAATPGCIVYDFISGMPPSFREDNRPNDAGKGALATLECGRLPVRYTAHTGTHDLWCEGVVPDHAEYSLEQVAPTSAKRFSLSFNAAPTIDEQGVAVYARNGQTYSITQYVHANGWNAAWYSQFTLGGASCSSHDRNDTNLANAPATATGGQLTLAQAGAKWEGTYAGTGTNSWSFGDTLDGGQVFGIYVTTAKDQGFDVQLEYIQICR